MTETLSKKAVKMTGQRYKTNPFLEGMLIPVKGKQIKLSRLGKDNNVLVNKNTGEITGTHVTTYKKVDTEQFVKLFASNIGFTFDLSSPGIKAFGVLIWAMQSKALSKDVVDLDTYTLNEFLESQKESQKPLKMSQSTFWRGLSELEKAKIVAKTYKLGRYFINPSFVFNGDRIAFTTVIERDGSIKICD